MAIVVEHDKRKKEILDRALEVFKVEGYDDVTLQKIADSCGITRTTLYIYFKNKNEIFLWSIKQLTGEIEKELTAVMNDPALTNPQKLEKMLHTTLDKCTDQRALFDVLLQYLLKLQKTGRDSGEPVRRRIMRLRHLMTQVLIDGKNDGSFKDINLRASNTLFYALLESSLFRLSVMRENDLADLHEALSQAVAQITV